MTWSNYLPRRSPTLRQEQLTEATTIGAPLQAPAVALNIPVPQHGLRIAVLPDAQVKDGDPVDHLAAYGKYIAAKRPDVVVCIGDFGDFPSLSTYAKPGSIDAEGQRYRRDVDAVRRGMDAFMGPIHAAPGYNPVKVFNRGNHEDRIDRAINVDPNRLMGVISQADLGYEEHGWNVIPFLQPVSIGGVVFCHYLPSGVMGRPIQTARGILSKLHQSAFVGHQQGRDIAYAKRADGGHLTAIISGSFYQHNESYLSPFTNNHWRGAWFLHEVKDGQYDEMALSLGYILRWAAKH